MANLGLKVADVISKFYDVREDENIRGMYEVRKKDEPNGDLLWYFFSSNNATYHSSGNDCVIRDINQSNSRYIERLIAAFEKAKNKEKKIFWLVLVYGEGIGLVPQEMEWMASVETKVDFNSITASLRMTKYPIGKGLEGGWKPCCVRVDQDKYFNTTFISCKDENGEFTDAYMKNYFEIYDNRPYRDLIEVEYKPEDDNEDIFKHNLFGIHITEKNDALSDDNPHVCIGWSDMGDMSGIKTREELAEEFDKHYTKNARGKGQDVGQLWRFLNDVKVGDYIIYAESSVFHIGRIESDYYYESVTRDEQDADYTNNRKVKWLMTNISRKDISDNFHKSLMTAMSIFSINDYKSAVYELLRGTYKKDEMAGTGERMKPKYRTNISTLIDDRNRIVFGAPGTGKSFLLNEDKDKLLGEDTDNYERVTFHPDYTYSQFVGAYKPIMSADGESIKYSFVPGPFMRVFVNAIRSALTDNPKPFLLLIEEINRAKVAAVFGDVFQLLDRDSYGVSEYEIQTTEDIRRYLEKEFEGQSVDFDKIRIPDNMFIWATMNSADQGVYPMDTAFKRRWNFEYLGIDEKEKDIEKIGKISIAKYDEPVVWNRLRKAINAKMSKDFNINEDKLMGPFFLSKKVLDSDESGMIKDPGKFMDAFKSKVIMYLYEDAVKQSKRKFFDGCDSSKYSSVCDAFDEVGMNIFGANFISSYYEQKRDDAE